MAPNNLNCVVCYNHAGGTESNCCHQPLCKNCFNKLTNKKCPMCRRPNLVIVRPNGSEQNRQPIIVARQPTRHTNDLSQQMQQINRLRAGLAALRIGSQPSIQGHLEQVLAVLTRIENTVLRLLEVARLRATNVRRLCETHTSIELLNELIDAEETVLRLSTRQHDLHADIQRIRRSLGNLDP